MVRVNCYVDGFNLYYRFFRNQARRYPVQNLKWLDIRAMCERLCGQDELGAAYYFTADVLENPEDLDQALRQQRYLNALTAYGGVTIVRGQFRARTKAGFPVNARKHGMDRVAIRTFEEKGSDVNIATLLLRDAFLDRFDRAIVISNDSDLALAVSTVVADADKPVHITSPDLWVVNELQAAASSNGILRPRIVRTSQLPNPVVAANGDEIHKPNGWSDNL